MKKPKQEGLTGQNNSGSIDTNGRIGSQQCWEITKLRRISANPVAWKGSTADGLPVHVSHVHGILRIEIAEPSKMHPGSHCWRDLLVVRPDYIELELDLLREWSNPFGGRAGSLTAMRRERRTVADWLALGECKSDRRVKTPRMTFWRLRSVLQIRDERLEHLLQVDAAGGPVRVVITAMAEGDPLPGEMRAEEPFFPRNGSR